MKRTMHSDPPTTAANLYAACYSAANELVRRLPGVSPLDVGLAHLGVAVAFLSDPNVIARQDARRILVAALAKFEHAGDAPTTH